MGRRKWSLCAVLICVLPANAQWGKLFYSPAERQSRPVAGMKALQYDGVLLSNKGKTVYWLNDAMMQTLPEGIARQQFSLTVREASGTEAVLQPGETLGEGDA